MTMLPETWCFAELGALIKRIEAGLNVKCEERPPQGNERGLVKISAVTWGQFDQEQSKTLPLDANLSPAAQICRGDLLFSRANTIELVGATVLVHKVEKNLYLSDKVLRLVVPEESKRWINYAMKTATVRKAIQDASSGNQLSMRNISQENLRQIAIPLAPLPEQKRIADKVDTVLARVDACRDRLDRIPALLKRFRQSVLINAASGKLTSDWRETHALDNDLRQLSLGNEEVSVPSYWSDHQLKTLISEKRPLCYGVVQPGLEIEGGIPLIRVQDMEAGTVLTGNLRTISQTIDEEYRRSRVEPGDLLISIVGTIGRTAIVPSGFKGNIARAVARIAPSDKVISLWLNIWLSTNQVQWHLLNSSREVARKTLNLAQLAEIPVGIPPVEEQYEIVRRVETLFAFADRLEARYTAARRQVDQLTPALLAKAFRGELVPQDPADEPASELLKRIQAAREGQAPARKARSLRKGSTGATPQETTAA